MLSSAVRNGDESDQRVLHRLKLDLAKDAPDDFTRDHLRTADELMERCAESFWKRRSPSFIQYRRQMTVLSKKIHQQKMTAAYDSGILIPIVAASNGTGGILIRLCADVDSVTQGLANKGENIKPTTLTRQLVELEQVLQSKKVRRRHAFRVGMVYSSRMFYGYVFWECPWEYWKSCWPSAALFAATDCCIRYVSIILQFILYNYSQ